MRRHNRHFGRKQKNLNESALATASKMFQAIRDGDVGALKEILTEQGSQLNNIKSEEGDFALHAATRIKNPEIVQLLVENGAVVNIQTSDGKTPLHIAVSNEDEIMVDYFISCGANSDIPDNEGETAADLASRLENIAISEKLPLIVKIRVEPPADALDSLFSAINAGDTENVKQLLDCGFKGEVLDTKSENGDTPLHIAVGLKNIEISKMLVQGGAQTETKNGEGNTVLHLAAEMGDISVGRFLQSVKAKPNVINNDGDTPLHVACRKKHVNVVELLLGKFGANINIKNNQGDTPLFVAVRVSCTQAIKDFLNSSQADQDVRNGRAENGDTLLHIAARNKDPDLAKLLVQWGAPQDEQNNEGKTPLHLAAYKGDEDMVKYLHTLKVNPNTVDHDDMSPLHLAASAGHHNIVAFFLDKFKVDVFSRSRDGSTLLHQTCAAGQLEASNALIKKGVLIHMPNKSGALCIHEAARRGHVGLVKMLLEKGVPVNIKNKKQYTPLHLAAVSKRHLAVQLLIGHGADVTVIGGMAKETPLHMACKVKGGEKVVDVLIKSGADPDTPKESGDRPLHLAARCGNLEVVKLLLREDAEVARRNKTGRTPIHFASENGHYQIVEALVNKVFQVKTYLLARLVVNIPDNNGETALHSVSGIPQGKASEEDVVNLVKVLLEHGANLTFTTEHKRETPLHWCARSGNHKIVEEFFTSEAIPESVKLSTINKTTENGASPLMIASQCGMLEVVRTLLRFHARVDVFDEVGGTALHYAASKGHVDVARELLNQKAYVNGRTKPNPRYSAGKSRDDKDETPIGLTPLHIAAEKGHPEFACVLVTKYNAIIDPLTVDKKSPLHLAAEKGRTEVCRALLDLRADGSVEDSKDMIPVHYAALNDRADIVELFFHVKPETMTQLNSEGLNAFQIASSSGSIEVVRRLVELDFAKCSADPGVLCKPLLLAARGGHKDIVEYLLQKGASPTEEDSEGNSVLHLAAKFGQVKVIDMLWGKTSINRTSVKNGMTAIHVAALFGQTEIVQEFLSRAPQSATLVSDRPADDNEEEDDDFGFTPLHLAAQNGDNALVRAITNHPGVRLDAVTVKAGRTALHIASMEGHVEVASTLISKATALLHQKDIEGRTALHQAAANGHKDLLTILIGQGAEIDAQDNMGNTALHIASKSGYHAVVKLLMEYGCSPLIENKGEAVPICLAASERQLEVLDFLLTQKLDHDRLLGNRKFLVDLVICSRASNYRSLLNFALSAPAPVHISSFLSRHYRNETTKNKEHSMELDLASHFCENVAKDLISISCVEDSGAVLNSLDGKNVAFLDFLIECELKQCVSHSLVQQYVTQIWFGELKWEEWKFMLLFLVALFFPPIWVYLSLPFKNKHRQIPIIKFICRLISHLYLILILCLTVVVPWKYSGLVIMPHWYEYFLFMWILGMLLAEISSERERVGLGWFPTIVVVLALFAEMLRIIAIGYDGTERLNIVFVRNQFLGAALMLCVLQLLQFLSIHRLFGPWGVIIGHLVVDVLRFLIILSIFFASFALQIAAVFKPLDVNGDSYETVSSHPEFMQIVELLMFSIFGLTNQKDFSVEGAPINAKHMSKLVFGLYNVLCIIVLINLLIAMMSDTYQRLQEQSDVEWKFGRARLIRNMERETSNPTPINLFSKVVHIFKQLYSKRCRCRKPEIAAEVTNQNGMGRRKPKENTGRRVVETMGESSYEEWSLIYSVVDWENIVEKFLDSRGERSVKKIKPMNRRERKRTIRQAQEAQQQGAKGEKAGLHDAADTTIVRMNVLNSLKV